MATSSRPTLIVLGKSGSGDDAKGESELEENKSLQEKAASMLIELGRNFAKTALVAGILVLTLYIIALQLTNVQVSKGWKPRTCNNRRSVR